MITLKKITSVPVPGQKKLEREYVKTYLEENIPEDKQEGETYHAYYKWNVLFNCPFMDDMGNPVVLVFSDNYVSKFLNQPDHYLTIDTMDA